MLVAVNISVNVIMDITVNIEGRSEVEVKSSAIGLHNGMPQRSGTVVPAVPSLIHGLPDGYIVRAFTQLERLYVDVERIVQGLQENEDGNQWLVVVGLSASAIEVLDGEDRSILGNDYRFQWEGSTGLIKVVPFDHNFITDPVTRSIDGRLLAMGISRNDITWAVTSTWTLTPTRGKQADQTFLPQHRCPSPRRPAGWPTLVIETGLPSSLPRLREDAKWWLAASDGDTHIVLVIGVGKTKVTFEKWQLAPSNAAIQQAYRAHEVEVTSAGVEGAPMILPFAALFDRAPGPGEVDVDLDAQEFQFITHVLF